MYKSVCFDLGDTLIQYDGIPLNWSKYYQSAFMDILQKNNGSTDSILIDNCCAIISKYNTRTFPRDIEYHASTIFVGISKILNLDINIVINGFFAYYQQNVSCYPDTLNTLQKLSNANIKIGILTDVPYGMPNELVYNVIKSFSKYIDCILTSVDTGYRKPNKNGFLKMAKILNIIPNEIIYVGNEEKDISVAKNASAFSVLINRTASKIEYGQDAEFSSLESMYESIKTLF